METNPEDKILNDWYEYRESCLKGIAVADREIAERVGHVPTFHEVETLQVEPGT